MVTKAAYPPVSEHGVGAAAIVAALLLPPLGVFLVRGLGPAFWIAAALTCVGFFPGIVFALLILFRPDLLPARAAA